MCWVWGSGCQGGPQALDWDGDNPAPSPAPPQAASPKPGNQTSPKLAILASTLEKPILIWKLDWDRVHTREGWELNPQPLKSPDLSLWKGFFHLGFPFLIWDFHFPSGISLLARSESIAMSQWPFTMIHLCH